jgi:hypothetical protein
VAELPAETPVIVEWVRPVAPSGPAPAAAGAAGAGAGVAAASAATRSGAAAAGSAAAAAAPTGAAAGSEGAVPERVSIGIGGIWLGAADGSRVHYLFGRRRREEEVAQFAAAYGSFRLADGGGELVFHGQGAAPDGTARRMLAEWTRAVVIEASGGAAGVLSPYGLAFAWHRGAATGEVCEDLTVYLSGDVRAGTCGASAEVHGRLGGDHLARLYAWVDALAPFQQSGEEGVRADALLQRLVFAGRGRRPATDADLAALAALADTLHHELAPGGGAAAPAPPPSAAPAADAPGLAARAPAAPPPPPPTPHAGAADRDATEPEAAEPGSHAHPADGADGPPPGGGALPAPG